MTRLIDADKLRARYQAILDRGDMFCEYDIIGMVDNAPTVERPRGEWKIVEEPFGWDTILCGECSKCKHSWTLGEYSIEELKDDFKFCPNCGARMEEPAT